VAKSNFVTLRSRQPVYQSPRELVMACFDGYFNVDSGWIVQAQALTKCQIGKKEVFRRLCLRNTSFFVYPP